MKMWVVRNFFFTSLLYNNSEDARFFRGFTGTITRSFLANQSARIDLVIIKI